MQRRDVFASVSGGGPNVTYLAGAAAALSACHRVHGWSGASAGAIVAAAKAFATPDEAIRQALERVFTRGSAVSVDPLGIARGGWLSLDGVGDEIDAMLGAGRRLGDALVPLVVCVTDLDRRRPWYLSSDRDARVSVREAVLASCSFMTTITPARSIPSIGSDMSPDVRLFGDGGLCDNTADGVWEARRHPRVLLRIKPDDSPIRVRPGDVTGLAAAQFGSMLWAQSQPKSHRRDGTVIDLPSSGWDFRKTSDRVVREWGAGYDVARGELAQWVT